MTMKEQLRAVAKEYARQFGKIIGVAPDYWVGGDISLGVCAYGDYFFNLDDMQIVVDNLNKWVKKYGTIEKVGEKVIEWHDWLIGNNFRLGLYAWLDGRIPTRHSVELNIKGLEDRMGFGWASDPFSREEYINWLKSLRPQK